MALLRLSFTPRKQLSGAYFLTFPSPSTDFRATHTTTPFLAGEGSLGKSKYRIGSYTSTKKTIWKEKKKKVKPRSVHRLESTTTITKTRNESHDLDRKGRRINNLGSAWGKGSFFKVYIYPGCVSVATKLSS